MSPALLFSLVAMSVAPAAPPAAPDISVPPGFTAKLVADNSVCPDIYTMTIDEAGRTLVAGRGYVRVLIDDAGDGVAVRGIDIIDDLKDGPMGLLAEGESLYVVADGALKRYAGYKGINKLKNPETILKLKTAGEHDAHAIRRGPDGWLYLLCGNMAGVAKQTITSTRSPVKDPVAGVLLRISPDHKRVEVVADGFRNPYSFDFNLDGEPFTYDSDNERCVGLPWYEPCRFYHVVPGGNYGWRSPQLGQFWRKPPYFVDCVPPVCTLGRGSPTGVACYKHTHFPKAYQGGFFLADWTFGRIQFVPLTESGATYTGTPEVFAEAIGTSGFAPTAVAVHPTSGELFVSIGGRGTRGGVYRISYKEPGGDVLPMAKRSLDAPTDGGKQWLADCKNSWFDPFTTPAGHRAKRHALELMLRWREKMPLGEPLTNAVKPNLAHADPLIRVAAGRVANGLGVRLGELTDTQARLTLALVDAPDDANATLETVLRLIESGKLSNAEKLQAARIIQITLGDLTAPESVGTVFEGYTFREPVRKATTDRILLALKTEMDPFPRGVPPIQAQELTWELARIAAGLGGGTRRDHWWIAPWMSQQLTKNDKNPKDPKNAKDVRDEVHFLACMARLSSDATDEEDWNIVKALLSLDEKRRKLKVSIDTFWPLRVNELAAAFFTDHKYVARVLNQYPPNYPNLLRPEHVPFVKYLKFKSGELARRFLSDAERDKDFTTWTPGVVTLMGDLPDAERRPVLLNLWDRADLRDAILTVLTPTPSDEDKFAIGLHSLNPEIVRLSATMLSPLTPTEKDGQLPAAVKALRRLTSDDKPARAAVISLLQKRTGEKFGDDPKRWTEWIIKNRPEAAKLLATNDGFDVVAWKKREAGIAWDQGDAVRGRAAFTKASCAACHDGGRALGPSLLGITKRFGVDDLLTSILQPSKDIPPRYRPLRITTTDEKVHIGMIVYEAQDGIILQTSADTSVRIAGASIASKRAVETSLMPAGLLDKLTDAEIADLFVYMKSLEEPKPK